MGDADAVFVFAGLSAFLLRFDLVLPRYILHLLYAFPTSSCQDLVFHFRNGSRMVAICLLPI